MLGGRGAGEGSDADHEGGIDRFGLVVVRAEFETEGADEWNLGKDDHPVVAGDGILLEP
jgi:hypothetical protein